MPTERQILEAILDNREYVQRNAEKLRKDYGCDYLAISEKSVIDHDQDETNLLKRTPSSGRIVTYGTIADLTRFPELVTAAKARLAELTTTQTTVHPQN